MQIIHDIKTLKSALKEFKKHDLSIGYVPTMGFLHEGHVSLMKKAKSENARLIVSIFVNPLQFGVNEDLDKYPRDLERDKILCEANGVDIIFAPSVQEFYGSEFYTFVDIKVLGDTLCGASRAGHFRGVCTVLVKFFNLLQPTKAYFGQKDAQQAAIVKRMVQELNMPLEIELCPIIREEDGLAKSSRNVYLNQSERKAALVLYNALSKAKKLVDEGEKDCECIKNIMFKEIESEPLARLDYVEIVDFDTMKPIEKLNANALCALAVYIGKTRLIDNMLFKG